MQIVYDARPSAHTQLSIQPLQSLNYLLKQVCYFTLLSIESIIIFNELTNLHTIIS